MDATPAPFETELPSRYVVGIDLGTTNSALCYVDTQEKNGPIRVLQVPQLVAPSQIEPRETLPSFHYQPPAGEIPAGGLKLPWDTAEPASCVGVMARDWGAQVSGRTISSAKSWLCHTGIDRTADVLPWHAAEDVEKLSPVAASSRYLAHLRAAWNARFKTEPLEQQDVVLTLPASFDEVARELTVQAAARAGLPRVVLIEEPQAAFYAWINKHAANWEERVTPGQKILVCDVGGGTTDFTLIRVRRGEGDRVQFHRVAVGDHLILGGDNFDLALAQHLEARFTKGGKLQPRQWDILLRLARQLKEEMLADPAPEQRSVSLPTTGSKLIGSSSSLTVTRDEVRQVLVEGFCPHVSLNDKPSARRSGFQEFGLPYANDAAITRYLAAFLTAHRNVALDDVNLPAGQDPARPDVLLFNGGAFLSKLLQQRVVDVVTSWFSTPEKPWQPTVLENDRLELAVARGAAYYGMVRRGQGVRIAASLARTYYIGFESEPPSAICLLPGNAEPGQEVVLDRPLELLVSEPVEFPLYVSSTRLADRPGEVFSVDREQMTPLPPIRTALKTRRRSERGMVSVKLHAMLTEIGTLELWCAEQRGERSWKLQFDVRSTTQTDLTAHQSAAEEEGFVDEQTWAACQQVLENVFGPGSTEKPDSLMKGLTTALEMDRADWPTSLLRRLWEALLALEAGRKKSAVHEARWLNLLGYALRPGYGLAVDDWRVAETWKTVQGKLAHAAASSRTESLILWRRIAGGFSAGQQRAIAEPLLALVRQLHKQSTAGGKQAAAFSVQDSIEVLRLLGSLELLPGTIKLELGTLLVDLLPKKKLEGIRPAMQWTLGRLGARQPMYGPLNTVVAADVAATWLHALLQIETPDAQTVFAVVQLARKTGDRYRDIPELIRDRVLAWLEQQNAAAHILELVRAGGQLDVEEQSRAFGESLPKGLRLGGA
ncbi:Chaperone protein DnaK [Anatilimnocola aggregata]|uniref:Chaperone protein DnaK n=1 Tax=Anatilimnocola aggregata TaxID=2528021 RepID=A0A517YBF6_9BACT|nr:hsp70 family protein [Anatilimnocola aggregata]QDU27576.1 Chaperone protein DnaK [Anatilimnocola aggregata]